MNERRPWFRSSRKRAVHRGQCSSATGGRKRRIRPDVEVVMTSFRARALQPVSGVCWIRSIESRRKCCSERKGAFPTSRARARDRVPANVVEVMRVGRGASGLGSAPSCSFSPTSRYFRSMTSEERRNPVPTHRIGPPRPYRAILAPQRPRSPRGRRRKSAIHPAVPAQLSASRVAAWVRGHAPAMSPQSIRSPTRNPGSRNSRILFFRRTIPRFKPNSLLIPYGVPWKGTVAQRVRIPPGKLSLQPVAIGADDGGNDIVRSTSVERVA